ncbi:MAG: T9SS type A sorting domain-containing protein [Flavobacteriales bacterium]|nr:T9SS type A sorting domain-containing protein [Flavobacteriales bacterium]
MIHRFPLEYGDMDTSYSEFTLNVPTLFSFTQQQTRYNEVDGWGTLYLPADTFEVLRVKSTLARTDSVFIEQFGQGLQFPEPETIEYKWIALGMDLPVLQINVVAGQPTTARFHYSPTEIQTGVVEQARHALLIWPNPAEGEAWLRLPAGSGSSLLEMRDATGRIVRTERVVPGARSRIGLAGLATGVYTITALGPQGAMSARLLVD